MKKATGYAVKFGPDIAVNTVSATERAAMVNGLVTLFSFMVLDSHTDEQINAAWDGLTKRLSFKVQVIEVTIRERANGG
jgi:hypothetical protein